MKIYISGKITGTDDYMHRFLCAERGLSALYVINPAKVNAQLPTNTSYEDYMKLSMCMLSMCDAIYMLDGWEDSEGARKEYNYAKEHGYMILFEERKDESGSKV